jgi:hypothetical protein
VAIGAPIFHNIAAQESMIEDRSPLSQQHAAFTTIAWPLAIFDYHFIAAEAKTVDAPVDSRCACPRDTRQFLPSFCCW